MAYVDEGLEWVKVKQMKTVESKGQRIKIIDTWIKRMIARRESIIDANY